MGVGKEQSAGVWNKDNTKEPQVGMGVRQQWHVTVLGTKMGNFGIK